jgi:hypothetical protein
MQPGDSQGFVDGLFWHKVCIDIVVRMRQTLRMGERTSRLRQKLLETSQALQHEVERVLAERGPLIRGSFGRRRRVCGKPSCRCTQGELHESAILSASEDGRVRQVHVPATEEHMVAAGVERYQRFRAIKARVMGLAGRHGQLVDQIGQSLLAAYPKRKPLPRPRRLPRAARRRVSRKA